MAATREHGTIAAVVVTRNRLALLQECVGAIRQQTRTPDEIIVIDNGSDDDTADWLAQQTDATAVRQENLGSAGGFHSGIKTAYEHGHDWIWCMDDDGLPSPTCLEQLVKLDRSDLLFRAPLVLDRADRETLAFELGLDADGNPLTTKAGALAVANDGVIPDVACPFNGILLHRDLIAKIGLPKAEMFLWGDEVEYALRSRRAGSPPATCVQAIHFHPRDRMKVRNFLFCGRSLGVNFTGQPFRDYLIVRNQAYIIRVYLGWWKALKHTVRYTLFHLLESGPVAAARAACAGLAGMCGLLKGHKKFLTQKP